MEAAADGSGWTTLTALEVRRTSRTADMPGGEFTTAIIHRTSPCRATMTRRADTQVGQSIVTRYCSFVFVQSVASWQGRQGQ